MADLLSPPPNEEEELRRLVQDHYEKLYTDDAAFAKAAEAPEISQSVQYSTKPEATKKLSLNWAYLESLSGRELNPTEYELERNGYAQANFGKATTTDEEFYADVRGQYEGFKKRNAAASELYATTINQAIQDQVAGTRTSSVEAFQKWHDAHQDVVVTADDELKYFGLANKARDDIRAVAPQAARIWDVLQRYNTGEASEQDVQTFADELASMPREARQKAIDYAIIAAQAETGDTSKIKQAALNMGKSISRSFGFMESPFTLTNIGGALPLSVPSLSYRPLSDIEQEAETRMDQLRRSDDLRTSPEKQSEFARAQQTLEMSNVVRDLRHAAEQFSPVKPIYPEGTLSGTVERGIYGAGSSVGYMAATAISPVLGLYAITSDEYDTMRRQNPDMNPHVAAAASLASGAVQTVIERFQLRTGAGMLNSLIDVRKGILGTAYRLSAGVVKENFQEALQDAVSAGIPLVMSHLREDMPDQNAAKIMQDYVEQRGETFFSMLALMPLAMFAGGRVAQFSDTELKAMSYFGFSPDQVRRISSSGDPAAALQAEIPLRTSQNIATGVAKFNTDAAQAKAVQNDPNLPTLESVVTPDGEREYRVIRNPAGPSQQAPQYLSPQDLQGKSVEIDAVNAETGTIERRQVPAETGQGIVKRTIDAYSTLVDCLLK